MGKKKAHGRRASEVDPLRDVLWSTAQLTDSTGRIAKGLDEFTICLEWSDGLSFEEKEQELLHITVGVQCCCGSAIFTGIERAEPAEALTDSCAWVYVDCTPIREHQCGDEV